MHTKFHDPRSNASGDTGCDGQTDIQTNSNIDLKSGLLAIIVRGSLRSHRFPISALSAFRKPQFTIKMELTKNRN